MSAIRDGERMIGRWMIVFAACFVVLFTQRVDAQTIEAAPVVIEPGATSFGVMLPGEKKRKTFTILNQGDEVLRLVKINPSCPCITGRTKTDLIAPGGTLEVSLDIEAGWNVHKSASKNVALFFEGYDIATNTSAVFAVSLGVGTDVDKLEVNRNGLAGRVRLISKDGKAFSVVRVDGKKPKFPGGFDPEVHAPRLDYNVTYNFNGRGTDMPKHLIIETDHPDARMLALPVVSDQTNASIGQWQIGPIRSLRRSIVVGEITPGMTVDFEFDLMCRADEFPLDATAQQHELIWVDIVSKKMTSSRKWRVKARMNLMDESFRGLFDETVVLRAGGNLQTSLQLIGRVVDPGESGAEQGDG